MVMNMFANRVDGGSTTTSSEPRVDSYYTDPPLVCQVTLFGIDYEANAMLRAVGGDVDGSAGSTHHDVFYGCNPVQADGTVSPHLYDLPLSDAFLEAHKSQLLQGGDEDLFVSIPGGQLSSTDDSVIVPDPNLVVAFATDDPFHVRHRRHHTRRRRLARPATQGTLTLLILRIEATDSVPDVSSDELYYYAFNSEVSLKSQLALCSWNQLHIEPTTWGVVNVPVDLPVAGTNYRTLVNAGYTAAMAQLPGDGSSATDSSTDVRALADLVMVVLPPGTGSWKGFASVGGQQSVFNNEWSSYVGATAHEIGHNLGLHHAYQDGIEYGDVTGYMGGAVKQTNYPQRCYNAQNHWHLGWYESRSLAVTPSTNDDPTLYRMVPFVDYDKASDGEYVLIQLSGLDLYLQYNRQKSFNDATGEFPDKLVVVQDFGEGTNLLAALDLDVPWYQHTTDGDVLTIEVCSLKRSSSSSNEPDVLQVSIGYGGSLCFNSTAPLSSNNYSNRSRTMDQVFLPVATVSALVAITLALTALFLKAAMPLRKSSPPSQPKPTAGKFQKISPIAEQPPPECRMKSSSRPKGARSPTPEDWTLEQRSASLDPACGCLEWWSPPYGGNRSGTTTTTTAASQQRR